MYPLIEIQTVPIEIQVKTKSAKLEYIRGSAEMEISRSESGDVNVRSRAARFSLDTFEQRGGIAPRLTNAQPVQTAPPQMQAQMQPQRRMQSAQAAQALQFMQASYEATDTTLAGMGQMTVNAKLEQPVLQDQTASTAAAANSVSAQTATNQTAETSEWADGDMQIRYQMDKVVFDWKIEKGKFKFTPGDIEIVVKQQPGVIIKYVGGPLYVPPSSDPEYEPVDVKV